MTIWGGPKMGVEGCSLAMSDGGHLVIVLVLQLSAMMRIARARPHAHPLFSTSCSNSRSGIVLRTSNVAAWCHNRQRLTRLQVFGIHCEIQIFIIGKNVTEFTVRLICNRIGHSGSGMAVGTNHSWYPNSWMLYFMENPIKNR